MRLKPPRVVEILAAAFGVLLLISLFLPWYRSGVDACIQVVVGDCPAGEGLGNAFESFAVLDVYLLLVALGGIGLLVAEVTQRTPAVAVAWSAIAAPLAAVATALVLWRTFAPPNGGEPLFALLGLAATAGVAVACALSMRNEGLDRHRRARGAVPRPLPDPIRISPATGGRGTREER